MWSTAALAVWAGRRLTRYTWSRVSGHQNPANPLDESTSIIEAVSFAAVVALVAVLARKLARRGAEEVWTAATGEPPPGSVI